MALLVGNRTCRKWNLVEGSWVLWVCSQKELGWGLPFFSQLLEGKQTRLPHTPTMSTMSSLETRD